MPQYKAHDALHRKVQASVATMRIIPDDSVLDPEHAPTCQACPRAMAHPGLQTKRHNAARAGANQYCRSIQATLTHKRTHSITRPTHGTTRARGGTCVNQ